ncbi:MAG: hypothetical protein OXG78_11990 [Chloroflexi bacterium]|nr:hypothetical protein [Chloroflexota bacterium]
MDIIGPTNLNVTMLDAVARAALGAATCGVSVGSGTSRIHLMNQNMPDQQRASDVLNGFGALPLACTTSRLTVGDSDPVISCRAELISEDRALAYLVMRDGEVVERGQAALANEAVALSLNNLTAGVHDVFLYRLTGNYASGAVRIQVDPA